MGGNKSKQSLADFVYTLVNKQHVNHKEKPNNYSVYICKNCSDQPDLLVKLWSLFLVLPREGLCNCPSIFALKDFAPLQLMS